MYIIVVPGATMDDLAPEEIEAYVAHRKQVRGDTAPRNAPLRRHGGRLKRQNTTY